MLSPDQLSHFRELLEKERSVVAGNVSQHSWHADGGEAGEEAEVADTLARSEENLLGKIDHALARIAEGSYGTCEQCHQAIPVARLEAKPSVSLCAPCQEGKEQG